MILMICSWGTGSPSRVTPKNCWKHFLTIKTRILSWMEARIDVWVGKMLVISGRGVEAD